MPKIAALAITKTKLWILGGALVLAGTLLAGGGMFARAHAQDCDDNAIIRCGFSSPSDFISKTRANSPGDLPAIYAAYGLEPSMYDQFTTSARAGTAFKDGRIVVDGQTVGTNGRSIGRLKSFQGSNPFSQVINGKTYWGNTNQQAFASNSIPVTVMFNSKGSVQFAVLNSCGNPEHVTPVVPNFSCNALSKTAVSGQANTFRFTTSASASNNATISKLEYDFGDGSATATTSSPSTPVTHTFTKMGTFTIKVTVFVKLPGNQTVQVPSAHCQTTITVSPPPKPPKPPVVNVACTSLKAVTSKQDMMTFAFVATGSSTSGATLMSADFDFGDGTNDNGVAAASSTTVRTTHTYSSVGSFTASAVLHFTSNDQPVAAEACQVTVSPTTPVSPPPVTPPTITPAVVTELPNTGAGNVIGIFVGSIATGVVAFRAFYKIRQVLHG